MPPIPKRQRVSWAGVDVILVSFFVFIPLQSDGDGWLIAELMFNLPRNDWLVPNVISWTCLALLALLPWIWNRTAYVTAGLVGLAGLLMALFLYMTKGDLLDNSPFAVLFVLLPTLPFGVVAILRGLFLLNLFSAWHTRR